MSRDRALAPRSPPPRYLPGARYLTSTLTAWSISAGVEQDDGLDRGRARRRDGQRDGRRLDVARQVGDQVDVVVAEGEVERFDLAAVALGQATDRGGPTGAAFLDQTADPLGRVRHLPQIPGHRDLLIGCAHEVAAVSPSSCGRCSLYA